MDLVVRPAAGADRARLQEIEIVAGERFRTVGLGDVADHDPFDLDELAAYEADGRSWVAERDGVVVGYVVVDIVGAAVHVEQVSVLPDAQGKGVGRALVERVEAYAREQRLPALTLTTFRDVEWNAPLYAHLGFRTLADDELAPELRAVRDHESTLGLDPDRRVCMRKELGSI
ncbi:MAG: GNAT family N-acetyltransferase [Acidimicrobiia bacterium]